MVENIYKGLRRHYPRKLYHSKKRSILNSSTISTDFLLRQVWEAEHNLSFCGVYWGIDMQVSDAMMPTLSLFFIFFFFSVSCTIFRLSQNQLLDLPILPGNLWFISSLLFPPLSSARPFQLPTAVLSSILSTPGSDVLDSALYFKHTHKSTLVIWDIFYNVTYIHQPQTPDLSQSW